MTIIHIRTSTQEQTPELQLNDIKQLEPPADSEIVKEQQSAWKDNIKRPELERITSLIKRGKVDGLYVWSLDRLYRNRKKLLDFLKLCRYNGTKVYSYNQRWLESINKIEPPFDEIVFELMLQIIGWIAESESDFKSKRVRMAIAKNVQGTFSYKGNKWGRRPFPKQTIDRVLTFYHQGMSIRKIAENVQVYDKNNNGRNISKSCVHKIIANFIHEKDS